MKIKNISIYTYILIAANAFIFAMEKPDSTAKHPDILIEDLDNLSDFDLEFKDSDQLELLLKEIDEGLQDPQNDLTGAFNLPEITDHLEEIVRNSGFNTKIAELENLKQKIVNILRERAVSGIAGIE